MCIAIRISLLSKQDQYKRYALTLVRQELVKRWHQIRVNKQNPTLSLRSQEGSKRIVTLKKYQQKKYFFDTTGLQPATLAVTTYQLGNWAVSSVCRPEAKS